MKMLYQGRREILWFPLVIVLNVIGVACFCMTSHPRDPLVAQSFDSITDLSSVLDALGFALMMPGIFFSVIAFLCARALTLSDKTAHVVWYATGLVINMMMAWKIDKSFRTSHAMREKVFKGMAIKRSQNVFLLLLLTLAPFGVALGQETEKRQANEPERARFESLRKEGFDALYNLDYEGARRRFTEMAKLFPDHPAGPQFLAASLWLKTLNESRRLQASLYNSESFYAKTEDKADPRTLEQFREWTRAAKQLAEARLQRNPRDAEALYFLGATEGLKAAFEGAVERRFIASLRDGSSAVDRHREVMKLDPNFHDAEVTIGMYDYIVGGLPLPIKLLAAMGGVRGSKKRGIETLERVAREGQWARDDAKVLLLPLYKIEKRFADAIAITRDLAAKYPRNYIFKLETADALISQAAIERQTNSAAAERDEREAFAIFEALLRDKSAGNLALRQLDLVHFKYGEALFNAGQPERAANEYLAAATVAGAESGMATMARLRAAQSLDLTGKRNEALVQYKTVLGRPDVYDAHDEAKRGLREPYKPVNGQ